MSRPQWLRDIDESLAPREIPAQFKFLMAAGHVKKKGGHNAVTIPSLGLAYEADTLQVR